MGWDSATGVGTGSGNHRFIACTVSQALAAASPAAETVSWPALPVSRAANSTEVNRNELIAVIPAAAPIASATVGEAPNQTTASEATPTPRKIAGKIGPPRKPQPRHQAKAMALARTRTSSR